MSRMITAQMFIKSLLDKGIIPPQTQRVVIDAAIGKPLYIYVAQVGTTDILDVDIGKDTGVYVSIGEPGDWIADVAIPTVNPDKFCK